MGSEFVKIKKKSPARAEKRGTCTQAAQKDWITQRVFKAIVYLPISRSSQHRQNVHIVLSVSINGNLVKDLNGYETKQERKMLVHYLPAIRLLRLMYTFEFQG